MQFCLSKYFDLKYPVIVKYHTYAEIVFFGIRVKYGCMILEPELIPDTRKKSGMIPDLIPEYPKLPEKIGYLKLLFFVLN